ncbi:MAG: ATP-dependent RecD-like DNA helicase [Clostridia bacterium]|nr:ATP-dependent RecD-like DNA helicase [Clostridia bacterium]
MKLKGNVHDVIFNNPDSGYTVLSLETNGQLVTVVGVLPILSKGEVLVVEGHVTSHAKYGEQFVVVDFIVEKPNSKEGVIKYLASGLIRGIGKKTAEKIYDEFQERTFDVIENSPLILTKVRGISAVKAIAISRSVNELKKMQQAIMFLQKYSVTANTAVKIYNVYKEDTISVIETNPYKLIDNVDGIGFISADRIAVATGHEKDGEFRIRAAIVYCLQESAEKTGHTYLVREELLDQASKLLDLDLSEMPQKVFDVLTKMVLEPIIKQFDKNGKTCISLLRHYNAEKFIASKLTRINKDCKAKSLSSLTLLGEFEKQHGITFDEGQKNAVVTATCHGVSVITGGPGTGKTTIIKCIAHVFKQNKLRVGFCAPTGRAAKRMEQSTGFEAKTIHRLLGAEFSTGKMRFLYNAQNPLPLDVLIVDETSMVDIFVFSALLSAIDSGCHLILVGDKDQLPSVGAGNVLADVIASKSIEVCNLNTIYRQSQDSLIVSNAHLINSGKMPQINNQSKDFFFIANDTDQIAKTVVSLVQSRLPNFTHVSPMAIQTMSALKSGQAGVEVLNQLLQDTLNPFNPSKKQIALGKTVFREGDKVMQTVNNYSTVWTRTLADGSEEEGQGVFNGDIGEIVDIDKFSGVVHVRFDDRLCTYNSFDLVELALAYAITVHKSQGSEFDVAVISLVSGPPTIINRNLLYTAITRAKKTVVLVGSKKVLALMVHNGYIVRRQTLLKDFLEKEKTIYETYFS